MNTSSALAYGEKGTHAFNVFKQFTRAQTIGYVLNMTRSYEGFSSMV